jgi:hypothetical protein
LLCFLLVRIQFIDQLEGNNDYLITVDKVNLSEKEEIEANVFFNNQSAMGEWDQEIFENIKCEYPEIDFIKDFGFDNIDLKYLNINIEVNEEISKNKNISTDLQKIKENDVNSKKAKAIEQGDSHLAEQNDYLLTIVFNTNIDKQNFNALIGLNRKEKYVKYTKIYDVSKDEFKLK